MTAWARGVFLSLCYGEEKSQNTDVEVSQETELMPEIRVSELALICGFNIELLKQRLSKILKSVDFETSIR